MEMPSKRIRTGEGKMKIALLGYGKMGKLIEQTAIEQGHTITCKMNRELLKKAETNELLEADVYIDFSHPDSTLDNIRRCIKANKPIVIGTTGWEKHFNEVKRLVTNSSIGCIHAPNFSIGMNLFMQMIAYAAQLMGKFPDYDVAGIEYHHQKKIDAPSGTAKALGSVFPDEVVFSSVRCGSIPGTHEIIFDSPDDTITLVHEARNREGFAFGALKAAEWIQGKCGLFTMKDLISQEHKICK